MVPVILAGGSGSRLWPLSRKLRPKQFLKLTNQRSMLQNTLLRVKSLSDVSAPIIICNEEHRFTVADQLDEMNMANCQIILEPAARDTAPAVAIASLYAQKDSILLLLAADHEILDENKFNQAVMDAKKSVVDGNILTFGIVPTSAHTGYGYIKLQQESNTKTYKVEKFVEKPDSLTAQKYLDSGDYHWNSGMFMFKTNTMVNQLKLYQPSLLKSCENALLHSTVDLDFIRLHPSSFESSPSISIDYAIMEKSNLVRIVPLDAGWSDVGCWNSLWEISKKDQDNNVCLGDILAVNSTNSYIRANKKLVATLGIDNLVVIETDDAILVADKSKVQNIKKIVSTLNEKQRCEIQDHRQVFRPWGYYDSIDSGARFQVKRIVVKPGAKLSVQMHHHRAEHWIVVKGTAKVLCGNSTQLLSENESTYIPIGDIHSLENPGKINLELIEVQSGSYLGEDDIVRFEDMYGRSEPNVSPSKVLEPEEG
ncbi:mannose-1-phosphate guanylyltransferase/mannose-6-phosphate isomerase [Parashewanella spongiae]|uniref:mannose-1-phosphate guanylyltransferase/mannose-6-phosphate isomerase n=1 Tax=Parashewanella spongiae TaxID=342950 RepID=UPI0024368010|nr:mannose-1-phosphate guanylyltransferase/mannose-6-phosphate isomerase [Parashewanella spongiae]